MSPLTQLGRLFSEDKKVDNRALNFAGTQPLRAILARLLYKVRPGSRDPLMAELVRDGIVLIEDFLQPSLFAAVEREADELMATTDPTWVIHSGTTEVRRHSLAHVDPGSFPQLEQWRTDQRVVELAAAAERRSYPKGWDGGSLVERITLGDHPEPDSDSDSELHIDTFFDTHKLWLYLDDVSEANGAFVYVPGSHVLDRIRLRYEYLESNTTNRKSRRVTEEEVRSRGLEPLVFACRRNTLVLANTCGYHARSVGEPGAARRSLHKAYRYNPFKLEMRSRRQPAIG
ncbi:MAG TPA: phytanoyl-CoA dioxygenase family protein [Acidimicrobiales bacterium]|nr:phytanoyl-CoA dioxygenase family protein [Acidimicrobiales bacterium]